MGGRLRFTPWTAPPSSLATRSAIQGDTNEAGDSPRLRRDERCQQLRQHLHDAVHREELAIIWKLRRVLSGMDNTAALEMLLKQLRKTTSNHEFLVQISRTTPN